MKANNLSSRFFYFNPSSSDTTDARMFPMSHLTSLHINSGVGTGDEALAITFEDSEVGDHTFILIYVTAGEGKKAMKNIVDAINSTQQIAVLADNSIKKSIISNVNWGTTPSITEGSVGTFALSGGLTVAGNATVTSTIIAAGSIVLGSETQSVDAAAVSKAKPVTFLAHNEDESVTLADGTEEGRLIRIVSKTNNTVTLTPASTAGAYTTIAFTNVGESVTLMWTAVGWAVLSRCGGGTADATSVATMPVLA